MPGVTLDACALIALERDDRRILVLLARARESGAKVTVPATALAEVVRGTRPPDAAGPPCPAADDRCRRSR